MAASITSRLFHSLFRRRGQGHHDSSTAPTGAPAALVVGVPIASPVLGGAASSVPLQGHTGAATINAKGKTTTPKPITLASGPTTLAPSGSVSNVTPMISASSVLHSPASQPANPATLTNPPIPILATVPRNITASVRNSSTFGSQVSQGAASYRRRATGFSQRAIAICRRKSRRESVSNTEMHEQFYPAYSINWERLRIFLGARYRGTVFPEDNIVTDDQWQFFTPEPLTTADIEEIRKLEDGYDPSRQP